MLAAECDERAAPALAREAGEIGVRETLAQALGGGEGRFRAREVVGRDLLERLRQQDVSALDAVVPARLEQTPRACRPAGRARELRARPAR